MKNIIQNNPNNQEFQDKIDKLLRDELFDYESKYRKREKRKKAIREWLILIIGLATFVGAICLLLNLWDCIPENIIRKLGPLEGGCSAIFVLFGSFGLVVLVLALFDKIYNRIVD
jgi:hypothetical protein